MKTRTLTFMPAGVEVAPDFFELAVRALEVQTPAHLNARQRQAAKRRTLNLAQAYVRAVDWTSFEWYWVEGGMAWEQRHDKRQHTSVSSTQVAAAGIPAETKRRVARRDGYQCQYCGLRTITSPVMARLERMLPAALPMGATGTPAEIACHPMQCVLRLTWDHVLPQASGGANTDDNIVVACGTCNFQKGSCTLDELELEEPMGRFPPRQWTGLDGRLGAKSL